MRRTTSGLAIAFMLAAATNAAARIEFSECGGVIPPHETGVLRADVRCEYRCANNRSIVCDPNDEDPCPNFASCDPDHFVLGRGATLRLNGHAIYLAYQALAVACGDQRDKGTCTVLGPGTIFGRKGTGIEGHSMNVRVRNLVTENTDDAVRTTGWILAKDLALGYREEYLQAGKGVKATNVLVGPAGIDSGGDVIVRQVTLDSRSSGGIRAAKRVRGRDLTIEGQHEVVARDITLTRAVTLPGAVGAPSRMIAERRLHLRDSAVDFIESGKKPVLIRTTCEHSSIRGSEDTWGVCSND